MATYVADAITFNTTAGNKTVAITPAVGELLIVVVGNTGTTTDPTVTDDRGGTYTRINGVAKVASADEMHLYVRDQLCQVALSHTLTMNVGGAGTGGGIWVARLAGMAKAGASAVRQQAIQTNQVSGTPTATFTRDILTESFCLFAVFNTANPAALTEPASFAERRDVGYATPTTGLQIATRDSGQTGLTITDGSSSASNYCMIALEFDTATPTFGGSGRMQRPGQPGELQRRRIPFPAYSQEPPAVIETPTFGGATAAGVSPTAVVGTTAAGATGQGNAPGPRAVLTSQGATGRSGLRDAHAWRSDGAGELPVPDCRGYVAGCDRSGQRPSRVHDPYRAGRYRPGLRTHADGSAYVAGCDGSGCRRLGLRSPHARRREWRRLWAECGRLPHVAGCDCGWQCSE
jgi:hypothetical protein